MTSSIKKGAIISYISIFLNIAISFLYTPWMIRQIGVSDYALYSLTISFISYFIMDFGLTHAILRFFSNYRAAGDYQKIANMVGITTRVYILIDVVIFVVLLALYFFIENIFTGLTPIEVHRLKGLYAIAGTFSILTFMFKPIGAVMFAYEYFVEAKLLDMIDKVGVVLLVCVALLLNGDVYFLILINGAGSLITHIMKYVVFKRKSKLNINWTYFNKGEMKNIFSFSMWAFGIGLAQRMRLSLIPSVLGILSSSTQISIFALAMSLEGIVFLLAHAINGLFMPSVSRLSYAKDYNGIMNLMLKVGRIQLFLISLVFSGFVIFGRQFLILWVGADFSDVYYVLLLLIASHIISLTEFVADNLVYVENKIRYTATAVFVCSLLGLGVSALLAKQLGAIGCGIGTCLGLMLYQVWVNFIYKKQLGLDVVCFFKKCHGVLLLPLIIIGMAGYYLSSLFVIDNWLSLCILCIVYVCVFSCLSYSSLFNKEEKLLLKTIKIKKLKK